MSTASAAVAEDTARISVLDALRKMTGPVTVPDVVARTGLPPYEAERQLNQIVREYESELDVDDDGHLVYRFPPGLPGREDIVKKDAARRRKAAFKAKLVTFFKAWTVAMVIIYFIILVVLVIAALVALASRDSNNNSSSRRSRGFGYGGGGGMWLWFGGSPWGYGGYGSYTSRRRARQWNRDVEQKIRSGQDPYSMTSEPELKKPSLAERTWYYLFGSKGIERNPLEQEKELVTYIRAKKGFISNADIIALLGVTYDEADAIGTRLVATYEGEMDLTDDGVAVYRFPNLMLTAAPEVQKETASLGYLWHLRKKEMNLRKHPAVVVPILNILNFVLVFVVWKFAMPVLHIEPTVITMTVLFAIPAVYSVCFFGLAMRRKMREAKDKDKFERDNIRISMFKVLFTRRSAIRLPGDERAIASAGLGSWDTNELLRVADDVATELRGSLVAEGGVTKLKTDRIFAEMGAVEHLRSAANSTQRVGKTVFTTRDDGPRGVGLDAPSSGDADLSAEIAALEKELEA
ncbi:MAG: hypothetical protein KC635_07500 [Myxococcales bacterium]|nr:hypothetical protein [Myxococcales bacterium]